MRRRACGVRNVWTLPLRTCGGVCGDREGAPRAIRRGTALLPLRAGAARGAHRSAPGRRMAAPGRVGAAAAPRRPPGLPAAERAPHPAARGVRPAGVRPAGLALRGPGRAGGPDAVRRGVGTAGPGHPAPHRPGTPWAGRRGGPLGRGPARSGSHPRRGHAGPPGRTARRRPTRAEQEKARRHGRSEAPRITLRRAVSTAAAGAASEEEFFARLRDAGVLVRIRYSRCDPGQVTGYAVALAGDTARAGGPVWFGGGKLAADLSLPKLRARWHGAPTGPGLTDPLTAAERNAIWEHAARVAEQARDEIRRCAVTDPAAASDAAWAASDTLHAAASALHSRNLRRAADSYARAARIPYGRTPRPTPAGASLRHVARLMSRAALASQDDTAALAALILQLAALVETVVELRQAQRHAAQASAARCSARNLRTLGRRLNRRWESPAAKVARLTAESFPVPPRAAPRTSGWHEPAASAGPRPRHGTGPPRHHGPSR